MNEIMITMKSIIYTLVFFVSLILVLKLSKEELTNASHKTGKLYNAQSFPECNFSLKNNYHLSQITKRDDLNRFLQSVLDFENVYKKIDSNLQRAQYDTIINHVIEEKLLDAIFGIVAQRFGNDFLVVEVGSWKGLSTLSFGNKCKMYSCKVIAVDTWLGSTVMYTTSLKDRFFREKAGSGLKAFYNTFLNNVIQANLTDKICPFQATSTIASNVFKHYAIHPNIIYIDGDHSFKAALADITSYWKILSTGGFLTGHDHSISDIMQALIEFKKLAKEKIDICLFGAEWIIEKKAHYEEDISINGYNSSIDDY